MGIIDKINRLNAHDPMVRNVMEAIQYDLNEQNAETAQIGRDIFFYLYL